MEHSVEVGLINIILKQKNHQYIKYVRLLEDCDPENILIHIPINIYFI